MLRPLLDVSPDVGALVGALVASSGNLRMSINSEYVFRAAIAGKSVV